MASFPSPFSAANPYANQAADAAAGASRLATALAEASTQQKRLNQAAAQKKAEDYSAGLQQDFKDELELRDKGYVPAQVYSGGEPLPGRPTIMKPEDNPEAQGGGPILTDKNGKEWRKKPVNDDTNSFVLGNTAAQAMNEAGYSNVKPGDRIPMAHAATVTEAVKQHLQKNQLDNTNSVVVTQDMADRLKPHGIQLTPGARLSLGKVSDLKDLVAMAEPKPAPEKEPRRETREDWIRIATDPSSAPNEVKRARSALQLDQQTRGKDPGEAPKKVSVAQLRQLTKTKSDRLIKAKADYQKATNEALDPEDKLEAGRNLVQAYRDAQTEYEDGLSSVLGKDVGHDDWADKLQAGSGSSTAKTSAASGSGIQPSTPAPTVWDRIKGAGQRMTSAAPGTSANPAPSPQSTPPARQQSSQPTADTPKSAPRSQQPPVTPAAGTTGTGRGGQSAQRTLKESQLDAYVEQKQRIDPRFTMAEAMAEAKQLGYTVLPKPVDHRAAHAAAASGQ